MPRRNPAQDGAPEPRSLRTREVLIPIQPPPGGDPEERLHSARPPLRRRLPRIAQGPDVVEDLVCVGCNRSPSLDRIVWSDSERRHVHTAQRNQTTEGIVRICGGEVVRREHVARATLRPGAVHVCNTSRLTGTAHLVRLGHPANARNQSWTGTALCGLAPHPGHWIPRQDDAEGGAGEVCPRCLKASGGRTDPR